MKPASARRMLAFSCMRSWSSCAQQNPDRCRIPARVHSDGRDGFLNRPLRLLPKVTCRKVPRGRQMSWVCECSCDMRIELSAARGGCDTAVRCPAGGDAMTGFFPCADRAASLEDG